MSLSTPNDMTPTRQRSINVLILLILGLCAITNLTTREEWPFCIYPMFKHTEHWQDFSRPEFFVVYGDREVKLLMRRHLLADTAMEYTLPHILDRNDWQSEKSRTFFRTVFSELVNESKYGISHSVPPTALRAYLVSYHYPRSHDPTSQVVGRKLLLEIDQATP